MFERYLEPALRSTAKVNALRTFGSSKGTSEIVKTVVFLPLILFANFPPLIFEKYFLTFVKHVWPEFIEGAHHKTIADKFNKLASGEIKRLIVNMPPRHTKSEFASYLLPAWFLGQYPEKKIIQTAHTAELSVGFGRKVRNLVDSEDYKEIF